MIFKASSCWIQESKLPSLCRHVLSLWNNEYCRVQSNYLHYFEHFLLNYDYESSLRRTKDPCCVILLLFGVTGLIKWWFADQVFEGMLMQLDLDAISIANILHCKIVFRKIQDWQCCNGATSIPCTTAKSKQGLLPSWQHLK